MLVFSTGGTAENGEWNCHALQRVGLKYSP